MIATDDDPSNSYPEISLTTRRTTFSVDKMLAQLQINLQHAFPYHLVTSHFESVYYSQGQAPQADGGKFRQLRKVSVQTGHYASKRLDGQPRS